MYVQRIHRASNQDFHFVPAFGMINKNKKVQKVQNTAIKHLHVYQQLLKYQ